MLTLLLAGRTNLAVGAADDLERDSHKVVRLGADQARLHSAAAEVGIDHAGHVEAVHTGPGEVADGRSHRGGAGRRSSAEVVADSHLAGAANVLGVRYNRLAEEGKVSARESGWEGSGPAEKR